MALEDFTKITLGENPTRDEEVRIIKEKIMDVNIFLDKNNYPLFAIPSFIESHPRYKDYAGYFYRDFQLTLKDSKTNYK